jgi:hypothetical protein
MLSNVEASKGNPEKCKELICPGLRVAFHFVELGRDDKWRNSLKGGECYQEKKSPLPNPARGGRRDLK